MANTPGGLTPEMVMSTLSALVQQMAQNNQQMAQNNQSVALLNQNLVVLNQNIVLLRQELANVESAPVDPTITQLKGLVDTLGVTFNPKPPRKGRQ